MRLAADVAFFMRRVALSVASCSPIVSVSVVRLVRSVGRSVVRFPVGRLFSRSVFRSFNRSVVMPVVSSIGRSVGLSDVYLR